MESIIMNVSIIICIALAATSVSIFSITGNKQLWAASILKGWNKWWGHKGLTSANKWKNGNKSEGERFWFSSTILSALTDPWHMAVATSIIGFSAAGILTGLQLHGNEDIGVLIQTIMMWFLAYGFTFNLMHHYIFMKDPIPAWQIFVGVMTYIIIGALGLNFGLFNNGWLFLWAIAPITIVIGMLDIWMVFYWIWKGIYELYQSLR